MPHLRHDRTRPTSFIVLALAAVGLAGASCGGDPQTTQDFVSRTVPTTTAAPRTQPQTRTHEALCRPCRTTAECIAETAGAVCAPLGDEGAFCATVCSASSPCPTGYGCAGGFCRPATNTCGCNYLHEGAATDCAFNIETTRCDGARTCENSTLSGCIPVAGAAPLCTGEIDACAAVTDPDELARVGTPCDGTDADSCADGVWVCDGATVACNDDAATVRELCNHLDDDCDGQTDEDFSGLGVACDGADADQCADGVIICDPDGPTTICGDDLQPKTETCNGVDDDCNGMTDEAPECTPATPQVCYPGVSFDWSVCFDLVRADSFNLTDYAYPASTDARYRAPDFYLDLQTVSSNPRLATNFVLNEFMQSAKGRYGVFRPQTVAHWQRIRSSLGVALTVNSGYRNPGYNDGIDGSATFSRHMYGDASDVTANGAVSLQSIVNACNSEGADYVQLYATHVHCDWRDDAHTSDFWLATPRAFGATPTLTPDPWARLWGDIDVEHLNEDERLLTARWGVAFDEGEPWVTWEIIAPDAVETVVVEPATSIVVPAGSSVRWRIGGLVEGQLDVP